MSVYADRYGGTRRSLGRVGWNELYNVATCDKRTGGIRCECGALVVFDTDGNGGLVALEARMRTRHECKDRAA